MSERRRRRVAVSIAGWWGWPMTWRRRMLVGGGVHVHRTATLSPALWVGGTAPVHIGRGAYVNRAVYIDATARVTIEDGAFLADHVRLLTGTHEIDGPERRAGAVVARSVVVGRGSWVGSGVVVLPGVTIAAGCVIGAGAVVTRDTEPDGLYVGTPARRIRTL